MYHYHPPKSSIWGHRLRNMPAARAKERFDAFLDRSAAEHRFGWTKADGSGPGALGRLTILGDQPDLSRTFEERLGTPKFQNQFAMIQPDQFDFCLAKVIELEASAPDIARSMLLTQPIEILQWRIGDRAVPTLSHFLMYYGQSQILSTQLQFESVEDFESVAAALVDVQLCKLNPKHLKPDRSSRKRIASPAGGHP